jgi:hypothetical protein
VSDGVVDDLYSWAERQGVEVVESYRGGHRQMTLIGCYTINGLCESTQAKHDRKTHVAHRSHIVPPSLLAEEG